MESDAKIYERELENQNETLARKLEETELLLDNINETQEEKEKKYQAVIKESLDTIYQLATALHRYKTMVDRQDMVEPPEREVRAIGQRYLRNFMKYSLTHEATVSSDCEKLVDEFICEISGQREVEKQSA